MIKICCPHCGYNKEYETLPRHVGHAQCPRCNKTFPIALPDQGGQASSEGSQSGGKVLTCQSCDTLIFADDAKCYSCGKILASAPLRERPDVELKASRFFFGCVCIALSVVLLGLTLSPASYVSHKGVGSVSRSEGADILLLLGIAWLLVIIVGFTGIRLIKPTPVQSPAHPGRGAPRVRERER